jgi:hypothetical protein
MYSVPAMADDNGAKSNIAARTRQPRIRNVEFERTLITDSIAVSCMTPPPEGTKL